MLLTVRLLTVAGLAAFVTSAAFAQQTSPPASMPGMSASPGAGSPADKAMMTGMQKMQQDMSAAPVTGNADRDFVAMMIPHHAGAIDMAKVELQYGKDPTLRAMARGIIAAQEKEIAEMQRWQQKHD